MLIGLDQEDMSYFNKEVYKKFWFRVAHTEMQRKLLDEVGPLFLTSANLSGQKELYLYQNIKSTFWDTSSIQILWNEDLTETPPSDIFEFEWETTNLILKRTILK